MSVADLLTRSDLVYKKYEKYLGEKEPKKHEKSLDPFMDEYTSFVERINELNLKAEETANEKNRALKAALNAELRQAKQMLLEQELPKIEKLVRKGKNVTKEVIDDRTAKIAQLREAITTIADGVHGTRKPMKIGALPGTPGKGKNIDLAVTNMDARQLDQPDYWKHTAETSAFRQDWEVAKKRQDKALDHIEKGLSTLKGIGEAMGETLTQQGVVLDAIDEKVDQVTKELRTNNLKLKGLLHKMRSSRNFCLDVTIICILLALGLYIYETVSGKT
ncbi:hypothetical protein WJX84_002251 [Apatococcus fuscideae]|uniref:t-SNARE coiled-coil homology domain-containing protein n=1 Tax=Apatococcus fuscideae TaxID=2026836 RepID=A0AAW1T6M1_9CHLO